MNAHGYLMLVADLAVIVTVARLLGLSARRLGQPTVIGEIVGGILLGPSLFGHGFTSGLFPAAVLPSLTMLSNTGICVFMFLVGLEFDRGLLRGQGRIAATVALSAILLPFTLGVLLALDLVHQYPTAHRLGFVLFLGTAMSVTAFPVLARILTDNKLIYTPVGGLALAAAAIGDVLAWSMLAVVTALVGSGRDHWRVLLIIPFALFLRLVVGPLAERVSTRIRSAGQPTRLAAAGVALVLAAALLGVSEATAWMGLHPIFGAFLLGIVLPREGSGSGSPDYRGVHAGGRISVLILLPVFFVIAGLKVNLRGLDADTLAQLGLIMLVAVGGKCVGTYLGARVSGVRRRYSAVLAVLINTRGLTELIVLTVGVQIGVLDQRLFTLLVVMAVVTTAMTGVLLRYVYPRERVRSDLEAYSRGAAGGLTGAALTARGEG